jgi:hypothetical protein
VTDDDDAFDDDDDGKFTWPKVIGGVIAAVLIAVVMHYVFDGP